MRIDINPGDASWEAARPLLDIVWSPDIMARLAWRHIVWAHADARVLVSDGDIATPIICHVGLYSRQAIWNDTPVTIGGIGGVATHPERRKQGHASAAIAAGIARFRQSDADFGLLFCEPHNFAFYRGLGWHQFEGEVYAEQPEGRVRFAAMTPFVFDLRRSPRSGVIDLRGLPW